MHAVMSITEKKLWIFLVLEEEDPPGTLQWINSARTHRILVQKAVFRAVRTVGLNVLKFSIVYALAHLRSIRL